jgi:hypothetical protein
MPLKPSSNIIAAINQGNEISGRQRKAEETEKAGGKALKPSGTPKFINTKYQEQEFLLISRVAGRAGMSRADFCRKASIWLARRIEAGQMSIGGGVIGDRRTDEYGLSRP